jgi:hypothetical protein
MLFRTSSYPLLRVPLLLLLCLALLSTAAFAQGTASIVGTVADATGAAVPSAKVTITNTDTGFLRSTVTNNTGNYAARELPIGRYEVRVEAQGFKAYQTTGIKLNVNDTVRVDAALQVGEVKDSITVEANAVQVQSDTNEVSQTITDAQVSQLATNGRNVIQLAALVPGAASSIPDFDTPMAQTQNRSIAYNGQRSDHNNWIINGGEAYDRGGGGIMLVSPSQDAIQEFKVMTSNYAADMGQSSGGMISMVTKAGTKQFHGGAWEYMRNNALDANSFFLNRSGRDRAPLRYNMFGFNLGGPVPIEKERKTFFFFNMEWRRLVKPNVINPIAVPRAMTTGDFSSLLTNCTNPDPTKCQIKIPSTTDPAYIAKLAQYGLSPSTASQTNYFPGNIIPSGLLSPAAQAVLAAGLFPGPNTGAGTYLAAASQRVNYREEAARLDHQFNDKLAVMASLIYDDGAETDVPPLWAGGSYDTAGSIMAVPSWTGVIHATYTVSPNVLNEASFNVNGNNITITDFGVFQKPSGYNVANFFQANVDNKLPGINIGSPYSVGYTPGWWPWYNTWRSWQWKDDISWMHGRHNMKFGASYMFTHKWQQFQTNSGGQMNFGTQTQNSFADFMLGIASSYSEPLSLDFVRISNNTFSVYALDDWRVNNRLTLNLGLRWEGIPHAYDSENRTSNFYPDLYNPAQAATFLPNGTLDTNGPGFTTVPGSSVANFKFYMNGIGLAGQNGVPSGLVNNSWDTFAPRVGFALDLTGHGKTILRSGAGIFYERLGGNEMYNMGQNMVPYAYQSSVSNVYFDNPAMNWTNGLTATTPYGVANLTALSRDYKVPTALQWSMGIQQQLRENAVLTVSYVGNSNYHQTQGRNINYVDPNDTATRLGICGTTCGYSGSPLNPNLYRPYQGWGTIAPMEMMANSNYNSLQASFRLTAWKNLTINSAYTWSHAFDIIDGELFSNIGNPLDARWDYGPAGYDRRHVSVTSFIYQLPFFRSSGNRALKATVGGWELSGIVSLISGGPLNVTGGPDNLGLGGVTTNRADVVAPITYPKTINQWFSTASFARPAALQWGNAQRNIVVGPGRNNWNMALFKAFQFTERAKLEFRAETFNTFNHTQWQNPNTAVDNGNFGKITNTYSPRNLQLGAKISF